MLQRATYLSLLLASAAVAQQTQPLITESIQRGASSAVRSQRLPEFLIVRTPNEWASAWKLPLMDQHGESSRAIEPLPLVDFQKSMVVGIILPTALHGCTGVTINRALLSNEQVEVKYRRLKPQAGDICTQSLTTAYHFAKLPVSLLPVVFSEEE